MPRTAHHPNIALRDGDERWEHQARHLHPSLLLPVMEQVQGVPTGGVLGGFCWRVGKGERVDTCRRMQPPGS